ncbi:hypothetical protein RJT34_13195 [Clitoria ternatea]|uniref:Transmembrane protein n=1 Tax=Clitoria ternatea TaxID=43366 RepID=A0AAN9JQ73_CLITE
MTHDVAAQEILQERREAIERGRLKGRRLFQSTTPQQQHEVRTMSFNDDESSGTTGVDEFSSSSSTSCVVPGGANHVDQKVAEMRVANNIGRHHHARTRYAVFLGGFAIVLLVVAMCMSFARSSRGHDCYPILVPT